MSASRPSLTRSRTRDKISPTATRSTKASFMSDWARTHWCRWQAATVPNPDRIASSSAVAGRSVREFDVTAEDDGSVARHRHRCWRRRN